jgi:membrane protein DedA with SNARE-associated domain
MRREEGTASAGLIFLLLVAIATAVAIIGAILRYWSGWWIPTIFVLGVLASETIFRARPGLQPPEDED